MTRTQNASDDFNRFNLGSWEVDDGAAYCDGARLRTEETFDCTARHVQAPGTRTRSTLVLASQSAILAGTGASNTPGGNEVWAFQFFGQGSSGVGPFGWLDARLYLNGGFFMIAEQLGNIPGRPLWASPFYTVDAGKIIGISGVKMTATIYPEALGRMTVSILLEPPGESSVLAYVTVTPSVTIDPLEVHTRFRSHNGASIDDWSSSMTYEDDPPEPTDPIS